MMGFGDGSGTSWTICKQSASCSRQITTLTPHHSIFTGWMPKCVKAQEALLKLTNIMTEVNKI